MDCSELIYGCFLIIYLSKSICHLPEWRKHSSVKISLDQINYDSASITIVTFWTIFNRHILDHISFGKSPGNQSGAKGANGRNLQSFVMGKTQIARFSESLHLSHSILSHLYCELKLKMQTKVENSAKVTYGVKQAKVVEQAATSSLEPAAEPAIAEQAAVS